METVAGDKMVVRGRIIPFFYSRVAMCLAREQSMSKLASSEESSKRLLKFVACES